MKKGFWSDIPRPIIGLSPMDGVTDAAFRYIAAKYGHPSVIMTEFTSVEGIAAGAVRLLDDFMYNPLERPIVAQVFGSSPEAFYKAAVIVSALGFDGIDINMGCPAKKITEHGAGAALIKEPALAKEIIRSVRAGTKAWSEGMSLDSLDIKPELLSQIAHRSQEAPRTELPVSVKTRIGYDRPVVHEWIPTLLEEQPVTISLHGRTLKQLYTGLADWDAIAVAASLIKQTDTIILGNGDVETIADATMRIDQFGVDGVLIGRAAQGNPWIFNQYTPTFSERVEVALEHCRLFATLFPPAAFVRMRKHLLDYFKGFEGARELRIQLMKASTLQEVEAILTPLKA